MDTPNWDTLNETTNFQELFDTLVPPMDSCDTLEGEFLRAVGKLTYDWYNNGMCNNTSGAYNFLVQRLPREVKTSEFVNAMLLIQPHTNSGGYAPKGLRKEINTSMFVIGKAVTEYVNSKHNRYTPNSEDMLDFSDPDVEYEEDEDDYYY